MTESELKSGINEWFGLTYANYLVLPRLILQSMPAEWQHQFVRLLDQIPEIIDFDESYSDCYCINYKVDGKYSRDPYRDYRRGSVKLKKIR